MRRSWVALAAFACALAVPAAGSAAATELPLYFTKGEQLTTIHRGGTAAASALRALVAGPTAAERARGFTTEIPAGTVLRGVTVRGGVASVDLSRRFESGGGSASMFARLAEVVYTATAVPGVTSVRLLLDGKRVVAIGGEGLLVDRPLTRAYFKPQTQLLEPTPPTQRPVRAGALGRAIQTRLVALGYLPAGAVDGVVGPRTTSAILAFQKWEGLARTGKATQALRARLANASRPVAGPRAGRRIEVDLRRQVALLVNAKGAVTRTIHVSTGAARTPTTKGSYRVFRKELRSWSVPFRSWLPYASYFNGGIAFHEYADVPTIPASHGCVRIPAAEAPVVYRFATLGTSVFVS